MTKRKSLEWRNCSEAELAERVRSLSGRLRPGLLCVLEGDLGAGKSSFAREILRVVSPGSVSRGSPTFPLVQEYRADAGFPVYHIDLYRLKSEQEFEDSGIGEQIDSREALVLVEWASLFPDFFQRYFSKSSKRPWLRVHILSGSGPEARSYQIEGSGDFNFDFP
jgi:tRNA threonylcarbamoyl adenosine modification protein YjeE